MLKARRPSTRRSAAADPAAAIGPGVSADLSGGGGAPVDDRHESAAADARGFTPDAPHEPPVRPDEYAGLGEHVVSVVKAANEAAARIRQDAEDDAARLAAASRDEGAAILSEANRKADQLRFEVEQRRAEADRAADATRKAAEAYADQRRREAEEHASRLIAEADQETVRRALATAERHKTLQDSLVRTEERLEQLVGGLRELVRGLEDVLSSPASVEEGSVASAGIRDEAG